MAFKGVAVSQIILLVLGILVLAVVAYLLYNQFVTTGGTISAEQCRAEATRACTGCIVASGLSFGSPTNCAYKSTDTAGKITVLGNCYSHNNLLGASTIATLDCSQYTGGSGTTTNANTCDPATKPKCTSPQVTSCVGTQWSACAAITSAPCKPGDACVQAGALGVGKVVTCATATDPLVCGPP